MFYLISCLTVTMAELFNLTGLLFKTVTGTWVWVGICISGTELLGWEMGVARTGLVTGIGTEAVPAVVLVVFADAGLPPTVEERRCSLRGFLTLLGIPWCCL